MSIKQVVDETVTSISIGNEHENRLVIKQLPVPVLEMSKIIGCL